MFEQSNVVREKVESGEIAVGLKIHVFDLMMVEIAGKLGLDFAWLNLEHLGPSPSDALSIEHFQRAAEASGVELLLRHPGKFRSHKNQLNIAMEAGVRNLYISQVETAKQVRRIIRSTRYRYDGGTGTRNVGGGRARLWAQDDAIEYNEREDETVFVGVIIENQTAIDNINELLQVPELGFIGIGSGDLAASLGHAGNPSHPDCIEAERTVVEAVKKHDIPMGVSLHNVEEAEQAAAEGLGFSQTPDFEYPNVRVVRIAHDREALMAEVTRRLDALGDKLS